MANPPKIVFELNGTYVQLKDGGAATKVEAGNDFWVRLSGRPELAEGRILWSAAQVRDSEQWEMHPQGDEVIYLLSGAVDLVVLAGESERTVTLRPNNACVVPKGVWHRIIVQKPANLLSVTPTLGTQQRPVEVKRQPEAKR
ncbi:MAG TPA: cupin domain-containing protein [Stellaceae bacterium]|nr:cupin domain-containing protein [Stellaceae bacterium]